MRRKKKPFVHTVTATTQEQGRTCFLMPRRDFDHLFAGLNALRIDGRVVASAEFCGFNVLFIRSDKK